MAEKSFFNPKDYISVADRIEQFYEKYPNGRIVTKMVELRDDGMVVFTAAVYRDAEDPVDKPAATGWAYEREGQGHVNRTSFIENCETSAIGRALANLNFVTKRSDGRIERASREEMEKVRRMEEQEDEAPREPFDPFTGEVIDVQAARQKGRRFTVDQMGRATPLCPQCGSTMRDNRPRKASGKMSQKAPDFSCLREECEGVLWPGQWPPKPIEGADEPADAEAMTELFTLLASARQAGVQNLERITEKAAQGMTKGEHASAVNWLRRQIDKAQAESPPSPSNGQSPEHRVQRPQRVTATAAGAPAGEDPVKRAIRQEIEDQDRDLPWE